MRKEFHLPDHALIQVHINPDADEKQQILASLPIDAHSLSSSLDPDEISRVEFKPDHMLIIWKHPKNYSYEQEVRFNVSSVGIFLVGDRLELIIPEDITLIDEKSPSTLDCVLGIFTHTTRHFLDHLKVIKLVSREIQNKINTALENEYLIHMFTLGESLTYYLHAITSNAIVLRKIQKNTEKLGFSPEQIELLEDIIIENDQCARQAEIYSSVLSGLMDARGTLVNNNMNIILKNLTIVNTVFLPLNLLASIGGMSEYSMMTQGIDWRISYFGFVAAMFLAGAITLWGINKYGRWQRKGR